MGALSLADIQKDKRDWATSYVPPERIIPIHRLPITALGSVLSPAYGVLNQTLIVTYTVRANWACLITHIVLGFAGPAPAPLPGDIIWSIDIDRNLGSMAGYFEKDYGNINMPLGSFTHGWMWPVEFQHRDNEIIRVKAYTNQNVATGPGAFITAALIGYEWPEDSD
jgi:hypothetical protein